MKFLEIFRNKPEERIEDVVRRGARAEALLNDPVIQHAMGEVRSKYIKFIVQSPPQQSAERENAYFMLRAVDSFEQELGGFVEQAYFEKVKTP